MRQAKGNGMSEVIGDSEDPTLRAPPMASVDGAFTSPRSTLHNDEDDSATWECTDTLHMRTSLPVVVSGQLCMVETSEVNTLFSLNAAVRKTLKLEAPGIIFFDSNNRKLQTDAMLHNAVHEHLFPFCGKISDDGSDVSGQAEDISQMQWRTIQKQMAAIMTTTDANMRTLGDVEDHLEKSATYLQALFRLFSERFDGISELMKGEMQVRKSGFQQVTKQFQEMNDQVDNKSETCRRETEGHVALLNEIRSQTDDNKHELASVTMRQDASAAKLHERPDDIAKQGSWFDDQASILEFDSRPQNLARTGQLDPPIPQNPGANKRTSFASTASIDMDVADSQVDDIRPSVTNRRSSLASTIDIHMTDAKCDSVASLASGLNHVFQAMELLRLEQKQAYAQVHDSLATMGDLGVSVGAEIRELVQQELKPLDDQIRRAQQGMNDQQARFITDLEQKLIKKVEHRFMQHESVVMAILKEATNVLNTSSSTHELPKQALGPEVQNVDTGGRSHSTPRKISCPSLAIADLSTRYKTPDGRLGSPAKARQLSPSRGNQLQPSIVASVEEHTAGRLIASGSSGTLVNACRGSLTAPSSARNPSTAKTGPTSCLSPRSARSISPRGAVVLDAGESSNCKVGKPPPTSKTGPTSCLTPRSATPCSAVASSPLASLVAGAGGSLSLSYKAGSPQTLRLATCPAAVASHRQSTSCMPHSGALHRRTL